jgi:hypothetical protein
MFGKEEELQKMKLQCMNFFPNIYCMTFFALIVKIKIKKQKPEETTGNRNILTERRSRS